jgi:hypothetical protein
LARALKNYALNILIRKTHQLLKMELHKALRDFDFYAGAFDTGIHIIPKTLIEEKLNPHSV